MDPLSDLLRHHPLPELAAAIRARTEVITRTWTEAIQGAIPRMKGKTFDELKDSVPAILEAMAKALSATDEDELAALVKQSPVQGLTRFHQEYTLTEIMQEDRLLRGIIVFEVEGALRRQMGVMEAASMHAVIDVMLQRAVVALVEEQQTKLRAAAETELKYLSFLSHDLRNNLNNVLLTLQLAGELFRSSADRAEVADTLDSAREAIADTVGGMDQLLEHERLRKGTPDRTVGPVDLHALAAGLAQRFARDVQAKDLTLAMDVPPGTTFDGNRELLTLVLQNLLGNAIKYTKHGTVRLAARHHARDGDAAHDEAARRRCCWTLSVSDQGPGISAERQATLFEAFRRGEVHGEPGVGLGLAIASQAAKLMGAGLAVDSRVGVGSTFSVTLPDTSVASG